MGTSSSDYDKGHQKGAEDAGRVKGAVEILHSTYSSDGKSDEYHKGYKDGQEQAKEQGVEKK